MENVAREMTFQEKVNSIRKHIKGTANTLNELKVSRNESEVHDVENRGEVMANLTLSYRHLEDASMRLGKVIQADDGGVSVYDKETTVGVGEEIKE